MPGHTRHKLKKSQTHLSFSCAIKKFDKKMAFIGTFFDFRSVSTVLDLSFDSARTMF